MQQAAHQALYDLADRAHHAERIGRHELVEPWRRLTTSDHVYYQCVKYFADGDVHKYFSPYDSPHDAYVSFMNVIDDVARQLPPLPSEAPAAEGDAVPARR